MVHPSWVNIPSRVPDRGLFQSNDRRDRKRECEAAVYQTVIEGREGLARSGSAVQIENVRWTGAQLACLAQRSIEFGDLVLLGADRGAALTQTLNPGRQPGSIQVFGQVTNSLCQCSAIADQADQRTAIQLQIGELIKNDAKRFDPARLVAMQGGNANQHRSRAPGNDPPQLARGKLFIDR